MCARFMNLRLLARGLSHKIRKATDESINETELRMNVAEVLKGYLAKLKITSKPHHDSTILKGQKPDSLYGRVIIEYEFPKSFKGNENSKAFKDSVKQVIGYIDGLSQSDVEAKSKFVGVPLDGYWISFVRWHSNKWHVTPLYDVNENSIQRFLDYLSGLSKRALSPENLREDFDFTSKNAKSSIKSFYSGIESTKQKKAAIMFNEWERVFSQVCGYDLKKPKPAIEQLAKNLLATKEADVPQFLFALHTYYALVVKLLTVEIMTMIETVGFLPSFLEEAISSIEMKKQMEELEKGGIFYKLDITNFLEGDLYSWYLYTWNSSIEEAIKGIIQTLLNYEPATLKLEPFLVRDLLKKLYQYLVPKKIRHDLGEYYTPDWLANLLLNEIGYNGNPKIRVLDPACGSGTFLVLAIQRAKQYSAKKFLPKQDVLENILSNIVGFDLNPLAVITARANYLIALGELLHHRKGTSRKISIPIFLADSVLVPSLETRPYGEKSYIVKTVVGNFEVPPFDWKTVSTILDLAEQCAINEYRKNEFLERLKRELGITEQKEILSNLYAKILNLTKKDINGIWCRMIKNRFAPVFSGKFDLVVGNPPWIRWGYLPKEYREDTMKLWQKYGLFSLKGYQARLGGGEKDMSMLFVYSSTDNYLRRNGKLGFLITEIVFKSKGAGQGFRRFQIAQRDELKVLKVHDMVELRPFEDAVNKTTMFILKKGAQTKYPIPYIKWKKKRAGSIDLDMDLHEVRGVTQRKKLVAFPVGKEKVSPWITIAPERRKILSKVIGKSGYKAYIGARTSPYGVYWLKILRRLPTGNILVQNLPEYGKTKIQSVQSVLEPKFVYSVLRGADIKKWKANPMLHALIVQDPKKKRGYEEKWLKVKCPKTYIYLKQFKDVLKNDANFRKYFDPDKDPFYSMYNVREETFSPYKVVWKRMAKEIAGVVVSAKDGKHIIPLDTSTFVPFDGKREAHYFCGVLNSSIINEAITSSSPAGRGFGTPRILHYVRIPRFNSRNPLHKKLVTLSRKAHLLAREERTEELAKTQDEIDKIALKLYRIYR